MIETKYTCDRCGHIQLNNNQMWWIGCGIKFAENGTYRQFNSQNLDKHVKLWCRKCCEIYDLLPLHDIDKNEVKENIGLEDIIREIIKDELNK